MNSPSTSGAVENPDSSVCIARPSQVTSSGSEFRPMLSPGKLWAMFKGESTAFKLACFYLFVEYVRPQSVWTVLDVLPYAQIALLFGLLAVLMERSRSASTHGPSAATVWLVIFGFVILLSAVFAYRPQHAFSQWDQFVPWVIAYILIIKSVTNERRWFLFALLFLLFSFKMSQHGFRSWALRGFSTTTWGVTGAPGFFHNSGEVGIQMCIFLPMSICFARAMWTATGRLGRAFLLAMPITAAATVLASNSRGAVLGAVAALAWLAVPKGQRLKGALIFAIIAAIGALAIPDAFLSRFYDIGSDDTSMSRLQYWEDGLVIMLDHPVLGVGFGNWIPYYADHFGAAFWTGVQLSHNILVQAGAELGVTGLLVFLAMFWTMFRINAANRRRAREQGNRFVELMTLGMDAGMIGFIISAQFVTVLYYPYFWIALSLTVALNRSIPATSRLRGP